METFDFIYHTVATGYPTSGTTLKFGNSWSFTAEPDSPDLRTFTLKLPGMKYYLDSEGALDKTTQPALNMARLEEFYQRHRLWKTFIYPHPVWGNVNVHFAQPLSVPEGVPGADGLVNGVELQLEERLT